MYEMQKQTPVSGAVCVMMFRRCENGSVKFVINTLPQLS